ncbi:MAG: L,D-transpeptidase [Candidatus Dormibacteria bacterium]
MLLVAIGIDLPLAYTGSSDLTRDAHRLSQTLAVYQREGLPSAAVAPLRRRLSQVQTQPWFSPTFWLQPRGVALAALRQSAARDFTAARVRARNRAQLILTDYRSFAAANDSWLTPAQVAESSNWASELARQTTPVQLRSLTRAWQSTLAQTKAAAKGAEASAAATVAMTVGSGSLSDQAVAAEKLATGEGLSTLQVAAALSALQRSLAAGQPGTGQSVALETQLQALLAEIGLERQVANLQETVMGMVDQASFEQVPDATSFQTQYAAAKAALRAATIVSQLGTARGEFQTLQGRTEATLTANSCGHSTVSGKAIYISISLEEMVFYDNGCAVNSTPVTTGRPGETTPIGTFSVFVKASPLEFISGYAPGSPNYYTPFLASYAMEFLGGGYYIHNAPWEPGDAFGPGSQDDLSDASHGCVHTPLAALAWAYSWTPYGTPVVVTA